MLGLGEMAQAIVWVWCIVRVCGAVEVSGIRVLPRVDHDGDVVGLGDGHEHDLIKHDLITPLTWLGHVGHVGQVGGSPRRSDALLGLQMPASCWHLHWSQLMGFDADLMVEALVASQVEGHGSEHAVAILANDVADLETMDVSEDSCQYIHTGDRVQVWLALQWLTALELVSIVLQMAV